MNPYRREDSSKREENIEINRGKEIRKMIEQLQFKIRQRMLEEIWEDRESLEDAIAQVESYSYKFQAYREKYVDKLADLQRIWNELVTLEKTLKSR